MVARNVTILLCVAAGGCEGTVGESTSGDAGVDAIAIDMIDAPPPGPPSTRQTPRPLGTTGAANGYYEYLPPGYDGGATFPLLVFWHGIGENGDGVGQLPSVLNNGPPRLIKDD